MTNDQSASEHLTPPCADSGIQEAMARICGVAVAAVGLLVLFGWATGVDALKSLLPGLASMKANTAICFTLGGFGLLAHRHKTARLVCGALMGGIALVSLSEDFFGRQAGIDEFLFRDLGDSHALHPGRMSQMTGICFVAASLSLLFEGARLRWTRGGALVLAMFVMAVGLLVLIGYAYDIRALYMVAGFSSVALHTAASFLVLGMGLLASRPDGLSALMASQGPGGQLFRRLLPAAVLLPPLLGWLKRWGEQAGWYPAEFGSSLVVCAAVAIFGALLWTTGRRLDYLELKRLEAEDSVRRSEQRYRSLFDYSLDSIFSLDTHGRIDTANAAAQRVSGYSLEELTTLTFLELCAPEHLDAAKEAFRETFCRQGRVIESAVIRKDGTRRELIIMGAPVVLDGKVTGVSCIASDITDRKAAEAKLAEQHREAEAALKESAERFRTMVNAMTQLAWIARPDGHLFWYNQRWYDYTGTTPEQMEGWGWQSVHDPNELPKVLERWKSSIATGEPFEMTFPLRGADGNFRAFLTRGQPLKDANGRVVEWFGTNTDVNELKRAEEAMRESERRLSFALQVVQIGAWELDLRDHTSHRTPIHDRIFGYETMLPDWTYESFLDHVLPEDRLDVDRSFRAATEAQADWSFECRIRRTDGEIRWIWAAGGHERPFEGAPPRRISGIVQDITERKTVETALLKAKTEAEVANQAKDRFIAALSHELRTPLTPVLLSATAMEAEAGLPEDIRAEMRVIHRNVELEMKLIDDLLDVTRISRGKVELRQEVVDAHECFRNALEICRKEMDEKHLKLTTRLDAERHHVWADPARFQQVFWNLLGNAVKFTPERGEISVRTTNLDGRLRIEFSDTGIGIDPHLLPQIFEAFHQGDRSKTRGFGGLGLGLSIAKAVMELHHGTLTASSEGNGKGATFTLELEAIPNINGTSVPQPAMPSCGKDFQKILLVEDNADTLRILARMLQKWGYSVRTADCVQGALAEAANETFDLLISDLGLPDGSGLEIMRHMKELYGITGVAVSGFGTDDDIRGSRAAGFEEHLVKPVSIQDLQAAILRLSSKSRNVTRAC